MRRATLEDSAFFLQLRNDPLSVRFSGGSVSPTTHKHWFAEKLGTTHYDLWVEPEIGTVRIDPEGEVSIVVAPEHRGHGHGRRLLRLALAKSARSHYCARIAIENDASLLLFTSCGFVPMSTEQNGRMILLRRN